MVKPAKTPNPLPSEQNLIDCFKGVETAAQDWIELRTAILTGDSETALTLLLGLAKDYQWGTDFIGDLYRFCREASRQFTILANDKANRKHKPLLLHLAEELNPDKPAKQLNLLKDWDNGQ